MNDADFLRMLREEGYTEEIHRAYADWLTEQGNTIRAEYIRLEYERRRIERMRKNIADDLLDCIRQIDMAWLDQVFPLSIVSPTAGRFYAGPDPESPPFVKVGDLVMPNTTVCIIEALKVFNPIPAGDCGVIVDVLVSDQEPVEFDQLLFRLERPRRPGSSDGGS